MLENEHLTWRLERDGRSLRSTALTSKRTGSTFILSDAEELALVFSAEADPPAGPLVRVADFAVEDIDAASTRAVVRLRSASAPIEATLHYELDGAVRRKWAEVRTTGDEPRLLLDIQLDEFGTGASTAGGGEGQPLFLGGEAWAAVEYPSGDNACTDGRLTLTHFPGRLLQPGETYTSHAALACGHPGRRRRSSDRGPPATSRGALRRAATTHAEAFRAAHGRGAEGCEGGRAGGVTPRWLPNDVRLTAQRPAPFTLPFHSPRRGEWNGRVR